MNPNERRISRKTFTESFVHGAKVALGAAAIPCGIGFARHLAAQEGAAEKPYALSINGDEIPWDAFSRHVAWTQRVLGVSDEGQAKQNAANALIDALLIHQAALSLAITVPEEEFQKRVERNPNPEYAFFAQTALLQEQLEERLVAKRAGSYLIVAFGFREEMSVPEQRNLARQKIMQARDLILTGTPVDEVGAQMDTDEQVQWLNGGGLSHIPFELNREERLYSQEFTTAIFVESAGGVTPIMAVIGDPRFVRPDRANQEIGFVFAVVQRATAGNEPSFKTWLAKVREQATIVSYAD